MLFGHASFAETAISALSTAGNVTVVAQKNALTATIGPIGIAATGIVEIPNPNPLTLGTGTVTIAGTANVTGLKFPLTLTTNNAGVITWNEIIPGANMVWTPIEPY